ncbi:MAG: hypothetical protein KJN60_11530 [Boseongicola sp.]|nr:hypothetical protein [Boseongicola sp.]
MELKFDYAPESQFYALRFEAGAYESVPFIRELRFWGVSRVPCPRLTTLAALIVLRSHAVTSVTLSDVALNPPVCTALARHFDVEIHPLNYDINRRDLAGGERIVGPRRLKDASNQPTDVEGLEELNWISLHDLGGQLGGQIRTNLDAFDLNEIDKNLIVALCCSGKDVGHIVLDRVEPGIAETIHRIGLELIVPSIATHHR